jgi:hypothetical protein
LCRLMMSSKIDMAIDLGQAASDHGR